MRIFIMAHICYNKMTELDIIKLEYELFGRDSIYSDLSLLFTHTHSQFWYDYSIVDRYNKLKKLNNLYMTKYTLNELKELSLCDLCDHFYKIERLGKDICFYKTELIRRSVSK